MSHPVHVTRRDGRILVLAPYSPWFSYALEVGIPRNHRTHHPAESVWEIDEEWESPLWWAISKAYGLPSICSWCLRGNCSQAGILLSRYIAAAEDHWQRVQQWAREDRRNHETARVNRGTEMVVSRTRGYAKSPQQSDSLHAEAARVLGIGWPAERDAVVRAFRAAALRAHPDQGGSDAEMRRVLVARDRLLG